MKDRDEQELEALQSLLEELGSDAVDPPEDLAHRAMLRVSGRQAPATAWWRRLGEALVATPWRLASAGTGLVALGFLVGLGLGFSEDERKPVPREQPLDLAERTRATEPEAREEVLVHFVLRAPKARHVSVVGDFNGWDPGAHQLERAGEVWRTVISLPRGRYEYQFVVDGDVWMVDPAAPGTVDDGFGGRNGVLEV